MRANIIKAIEEIEENPHRYDNADLMVKWLMTKLIDLDIHSIAIIENSI